MGTMVVGDEPMVNPADAVFMRAVELADIAGRAGRPFDLRVLVDVPVPRRGLPGWLGQTVPRPVEQFGWDMGTFNRGSSGNVKLMLGGNGSIYFAPLSACLQGGSHGPSMQDAEELDHRHFNGSSHAENVLRVLDRFSVEAGLR
jgi:hypothetical protein